MVFDRMDYRFLFSGIVLAKECDFGSLYPPNTWPVLSLFSVRLLNLIHSHVPHLCPPSAGSLYAFCNLHLTDSHRLYC